MKPLLQDCRDLSQCEACEISVLGCGESPSCQPEEILLHLEALRRIKCQTRSRPTAVPNLLTHVSTDEEPPTRSELSWKDRVLRLGDASTENRWRGVPASLAIAGLITILGFWIEPVIRGPNLAIFYMLAVVFSAVRWGRWAVIINAISSALLFDYFFVPPYRSFVIGDVWYLITLIGLLTVGLIVSTLMVATREEARAARRREDARIGALLLHAVLGLGKRIGSNPGGGCASFYRDLSATHRRIIARRRRIDSAFSQCRVGLRRRLRTRPRLGYSRMAKRRVVELQTFSGSRIRYRPLKTGPGIVGVIGFQTKSSKDLLPPDQRELLGIFLDQTALAITRADLAKKAKRAEVLQEADKLQKSPSKFCFTQPADATRLGPRCPEHHIGGCVAARYAHTAEPFENRSRRSKTTRLARSKLARHDASRRRGYTSESRALRCARRGRGGTAPAWRISSEPRDFSYHRPGSAPRAYGRCSNGAGARQLAR